MEFIASLDEEMYIENIENIYNTYKIFLIDLYQDRSYFSYFINNLYPKKTVKSIVAHKQLVLYHASLENHTKIIKYLLLDEQNIIYDWSQLLSYIMIHNNIEILEICLSNELKSRIDLGSSLSHAIAWERTEIVKMLLNDKRINANAQNNHALKIATNSKNVRQLLLIPSVSPTSICIRIEDFESPRCRYVMLTDTRLNFNKIVENSHIDHYQCKCPCNIWCNIF